jgi:hypothetical protein
MHRTREEQDAVTTSLKTTGGPWTCAPDYDNYSRADLSKKLEQVREAVVMNTNADAREVEAAFETSQAFIESAFDIFEGKRHLCDKVGRAFVVPMRSDRTTDAYATESIPFYPLLDPLRFGVTSEIRMRTIYGVPPTVLDTYLKSDKSDETGALVLAPLYSDMTSDILTTPTNAQQAVRLSAVVNKILGETAFFAHKRLGARYLGLGATLPHPSLTDFGRKIRTLPGMDKVVTTTGHGGTVFMIAKTASSVIAESPTDFGGRIGLLGGAGSIGWSSIHAIHQIVPEARIHVFDKREDRMRELLDSASYQLNNVMIADSAADVMKHSKLVISAITETIDLDGPGYADIDFSGTVWIDDSQPGSVDRVQLERRGGSVLWVAGMDCSPNGFMTKDGFYTRGVAYNYGSASGLYGPTTEFACGLEAGVVAASQDPLNAVCGPVTIDDVLKVGQLFDEYGVEIAPFQSYGRPVHLN